MKLQVTSITKEINYRLINTEAASNLLMQVAVVYTSLDVAGILRAVPDECKAPGWAGGYLLYNKAERDKLIRLYLVWVTGLEPAASTTPTMPQIFFRSFLAVNRRIRSKPDFFWCFLGVNAPYIPRPDMVEAHFCPFFDRFLSIFFRDVPVINIHMWSDMVITCGQIFMWSNINLTVFLCGCMQRTSCVVNADPRFVNRSRSYTKKPVPHPIRRLW